MPTLVDQFGPYAHDAPITAAAGDVESGKVATADATGHVSVRRGTEGRPVAQVRLGPARVGAVALIRGGAMFAAGDDDGSVGVYDADTGEELFKDVREGARGRVRAMRGVAISPEGARLAAIGADGLVRIWDIERGEREVAWQGFGGLTVEFDPRGARLLGVDAEGQPRLLDLASRQPIALDRLPMPVERALFSADGTLVVAGGAAGLAVLRVVDGSLVKTLAARGGSGLVGLLLAPGSDSVASVSPRSVHTFSLPDLEPGESWRHGAPEPGAALWIDTAPRVGGADGLLHGPGVAHAGATRAVAGFGDRRLVLHADAVACWRADQLEQRWPIPDGVDVALDRDGRLAAITGLDGRLVVLEVATGTPLLDAGLVERGTVSLGGNLVAARRGGSGARLWDLARNRTQDIPGARAAVVSAGGTWVALVDARSRVRVLDPATGAPAVTDPAPAGEAAVRLAAFVNRRPDLLVIDAEHILTAYDLAGSLREGTAAAGRDVLQFSSPPDRIWGITGGRYAAVRLPEGETCSLVYADLAGQAVAAEVSGLDPRTTVDPETGLILEPVRGNAVLEREMDGIERRLLRALPGGEWVSVGPLGILAASPRAAPWLA